MTSKQERTWIAEMDDVEARYPTKEALLAALSGFQERAQGGLSVSIDRGLNKGWLRFLGGAERDVVPCLSLEWFDQYASLIFLDDAWSEYRAIDTEHPVAPEEEIRKLIAHGEPSAHPIEECMSTVRAFDAAHEFIESGERPTWLSFKYVR